MAPPTRSSIRWPSTVWVRMIAHSASLSGPGLLMISFGIATLPTSCSSAPNSTLRRWSAPKAHLVGDLQRELDDVARVHARVGVVGVDDLGQHHRGAAVGAVELGELLEPHCAARFANTASTPNSGIISDHVVRRLVDREGGEQADGREHRVEHVDHVRLADLVAPATLR